MGLDRQRPDEDPHAAAEGQHQVKGRLFLGVVVRQGAVVLEMLAGRRISLFKKVKYSSN